MTATEKISKFFFEKGLYFFWERVLGPTYSKQPKNSRQNVCVQNM